jgi:hypothetical protein
MSNTQAYMAGRKKYSRPQAVLFSDNPGTVVSYTDPNTNVISNFHIPLGYEYGNDLAEDPTFIILSDDNRSPINFSTTRLEKRERMINGRMRSYHIADKLNIDVSWNLLPSRAFRENPEFNTSSTAPEAGKPDGLVTSVDHDNSSLTTAKTVKSFGSAFYKDQQFTTDGGAGGADILDWYKNHQGPFYVYLAYDNYKNFTSDDPYANLDKYNEVVEVYFSRFDYTVERRGSVGTGYDFWNISVSLEEV